MLVFDDVRHQVDGDRAACWEGRSVGGRTGDYILVTACERCGAPGESTDP